MRRRRLLALGLGVALGARRAHAQAFMPNLAFNWTFSDLDAQLDWLPDDYPNTTARDFAWTTGGREAGAGAGSWHSASAVPVAAQENSIGANAPFGPAVPALHFRFLGTALYIYGAAHGANGTWAPQTLTLGVDQQETDVREPTGPLVASRDDLPWGYHVCSLFLNYGNLTVERVVVTTGMKTKAPSLDRVSVQTQYALLGDNATVNPFFQLTGRWNVSRGLGGSATAPALPYPHITSSNNNSYLQFNIPHNTSYLVVNGTAGPDNGIMFYLWNVSPPLVEQVSGFSAYNAWAAPNVMYAMTLDPGVVYNLTLGPFTSTNKTGNAFALHSVAFYSALSDYKPSTAGATATGIGLGSLALAAAVAGASYWRGRRRGRGALRM
ncbi:hypothetical protein Q8F55_001355 [Vanrija albida]|uniref:Uncharacterized protein n=1 Tax=Vanrija albida TaxID=181172 RepID=A0ABR3QGU1_9TREE